MAAKSTLRIRIDAMLDPVLYSLVEAVPVRYRQEYIRDLVVTAWNTPTQSRVPIGQQPGHPKPVIRVQIRQGSLPPEIEDWINASARPVRRLAMLANFGAQHIADHPALPQHPVPDTIPVLSVAVQQSWPETIKQNQEDVRQGSVPDHISALINHDLDWS